MARLAEGRAPWLVIASDHGDTFVRKRFDIDTQTRAIERVARL